MVAALRNVTVTLVGRVKSTVHHLGTKNVPTKLRDPIIGLPSNAFIHIKQMKTSNYEHNNQRVERLRISRSTDSPAQQQHLIRWLLTVVMYVSRKVTFSTAMPLPPLYQLFLF